MATRTNTRLIWEVLGKGLDFMFYVAAAAFIVALFFEPARSSSLLVLISGAISLILAAAYISLHKED